MKEQTPREFGEMSQEDVRDWLYSDLNELIDMGYDNSTEKGGAEK